MSIQTAIGLTVVLVLLQFWLLTKHKTTISIFMTGFSTGLLYTLVLLWLKYY